MAVKRSQSAARVLTVLETIARHQPVGVSELARLLAADKSAVQRAVMTLADDGWIKPAPSGPTRWQLTAHILAVAHEGLTGNDLRQRARPALEALRDETGETVLLTQPDVKGFVVVDAVESRQLVRAVLRIGLFVPVRGSATGRAILPYLSPARQLELLGAPPDAAMKAEFEAMRARGYSISVGDVAEDSTSIAAPIFEMDGVPVGAIVVSGPSDRLSEAHPRIGAMVEKAARALSHSSAPLGAKVSAPTMTGIKRRKAWRASTLTE